MPTFTAKNSTAHLPNFPKPICRFVLNGINGPQSGIAGMLSSRGRAGRFVDQAEAAVRELTRSKASMPCGSTCRVARVPGFAGPDGDQFDQRLPGVYEQMVKLKDLRRKTGCLSSRTAISTSISRWLRVKVDPRRPASRSPCGVAIRLATLLAENYVNRSISRAVVSGHSTSAARDRLSPEALGRYYVPTRPASRCALDRGLDRNGDRSERVDPLQPVELRNLPGGANAGVTVGRRDFLEGEAKKLPAVLARLSRRLPAIRAGGNQLASLSVSPSSSSSWCWRRSSKACVIPGDHDQRSNGDRRRVDPAVLRYGTMNIYTRSDC